MNVITLARNYAIDRHQSVNHLYDGQPYSVHLNMVAENAYYFIDLAGIDNQDFVVAGAWVHDVIEDTRQTYNDVKSATCVEVAEIAYALTNEKGRTRKERANDKYYEGVRANPLAHYVKLCDRIANVDYSARKKSRMLDVYRDEYEDFKRRLFCDEYKPMFDRLEELFK